MYRSEDHRTHSPSNESGIEMAGAQATDNWARVKRRLRAELGEDVFASWFARLELDASYRPLGPVRFRAAAAHLAESMLADPKPTS